MIMPTPPRVQDTILRLPDVRRKVGLGTTSIYELMAADEFPRSIPLGARLVGWSANELDAWIERQKSKRDVAA